MKIEFQCTDPVLSNKEILDTLNEINHKYAFVKKITVLPAFIKSLKNKVFSSMLLSTVIDFPMGVLDTTHRLSVAQKAIDDGATSIECVVPSHFINNKDNIKIKKDIEMMYDLCVKNTVELSFILEYRKYSYSCLYRIIKNIVKFGIYNIYISTGRSLDNIYDHMIAMALIKKEISDINIICNANIYNEDHLDLLEAANFNHFRVNSLNTLNMIVKKYPIK